MPRMDDYDFLPSYCVFDDLRSFRTAPGLVTYCRTPQEFIDYAIESRAHIDVLVLDHDLGIDQYGNYLDVRDALRRYTAAMDTGDVKCPGSVFVVTANPSGAQWIALEMQQYADDVIMDPNGRRLGLEARW